LVAHHSHHRLDSPNQVTVRDASYGIASVAYQKGEYSKASHFFGIAAQLGHALSQFNMGLMHQNGWGVPQNSKHRGHWYRLAADQGDRDAQVNLGVLY